MTRRATTLIRRIAIGAIGVVVCTSVWLQFGRSDASQTRRRIAGQVAGVDTVLRTASLEFIHPRSGQRFKVSGRVPANCEIRIDGAPARLSDVMVGDTADVEATIGANKEVTADWIHISRKETATSLPATTSSHVTRHAAP